LDDELDHRLLVPVNSPALTLKHSGDIIELSWNGDNGDLLEMRAPRQAVALVDAEQITAKSVAHWCREQLRSHFPVNVEQLTLSFVAETIDGASYHYSHGLKKHNGNCQRIAHGHRSRIQIWLDDERSSALEQQWAERWADIYLGSKEDLISEQDGQLLFRYSAQQGEFELSLPASRNYMMNTDTTVEFIARHLADTIKQQHPDSRVKVRAFEGVNKGAIANA
jgi:6-pyruvoyl-tetrahydropterin synthase